MRRFVVVAVLVLCGFTARATSVYVLSLAQMRARADVVVRAHVVAQETALEGDRPVTYTTLDVVEVWKGAAPHERLVLYQAGALDGVHVRWIAGAHVFSVGDDVVIFGERVRHAGNPVVVTLTLGYGTFAVDGQGAVREDAGGAVDVVTGRVTRPRAFPSVQALHAAVERP